MPGEIRLDEQLDNPTQLLDQHGGNFNCITVCLNPEKSSNAKTVGDAILGPPHPFDFERPSETARKLAMKPYDVGSIRYPELLHSIDFEAHQRIRFRSERSIWADWSNPYPIQFFHLGRHFKRPASIYLLVGLKKKDKVQGKVTVSRGTIEDEFAIQVVETKKWRAFFDLDVEGDEPVDRRCFLRFGDQALTKTWLYQYLPSDFKRTREFES